MEVLNALSAVLRNPKVHVSTDDEDHGQDLAELIALEADADDKKLDETIAAHADAAAAAAGVTPAASNAVVADAVADAVVAVDDVDTTPVVQDEDILLSNLTNMLLEPEKLQAGLPKDSLCPNSVKAFFKRVTFTNTNVPEVEDMISKLVKTAGYIPSVSSLNFGSPHLTLTWVVNFLCTRSSLTQQKNNYSTDEINAIKRGASNGSKLKQSFNQIMSNLGQVLNVFSYLLHWDRPESNTNTSDKTWLAAADLQARNEFQENNRPNSATPPPPPPAENNGHRLQPASQIFEEGSTPFPMNFSDDHALAAICSPAFAIVWGQFVGTVNKAPKSKRNKIHFLIGLIHWAKRIFASNQEYVTFMIIIIIIGTTFIKRTKASLRLSPQG